jgi:predicted short-subunit dehydrogenase-like oxidoreductase (DUF2520 family)
MTEILTPQWAVVGPGRLGSAFHSALSAHGLAALESPLGRADDFAQLAAIDCVLLAVPDRAITEVAARVPGGPLVIHASGATALDALVPHARRGVLHPLMTVPTPTTDLTGAPCAISAATTPDRQLLLDLARTLRMQPFEVAEEDRAAYHAAASIASNALVALEVAAERLMATAGVPRSALVPLVESTVRNWAADGAAALTGPVSRGDWVVVARQRDAVAERLPDLLPLFDAQVAACAALAARSDDTSLPAPVVDAAPEVIA